jgi:hypothetical protein
VIEEPRFVPLRDLPSVALYPPIVFEILEDAEAGWGRPPRYLGNVWVEADQDVELDRIPAAARRLISNY